MGTWDTRRVSNIYLKNYGIRYLPKRRKKKRKEEREEEGVIKSKEKKQERKSA